MKGMTIMLLVMVASVFIAGMWNKVEVIKDSVHLILDPTAGSLLNWNKTFGMFLTVVVIALALTLMQKYGTDQQELRKIKGEQKILQEEMKKYRDQPEKIMELNKKQLEFIPKTFNLTLKPLIYTFIPFILFFRWFMDYFSAPGVEAFRFFGFLSWFWFYLIFSIVFSSIFRKVLKVA